MLRAFQIQTRLLAWPQKDHYRGRNPDAGKILVVFNSTIFSFFPHPALRVDHQQARCACPPALVVKTARCWPRSLAISLPACDRLHPTGPVAPLREPPVTVKFPRAKVWPQNVHPLDPETYVQKFSSNR